MEILYVLITIFAALDLYFIISALIIYIKYKKQIHHFELTQGRISHLGIVIAVCGEIRKGKSSFVSGLIHSIELNICNKLMNIMNEAILRLNFVDFNYIDELIIKNSNLPLKSIIHEVLRNVEIKGIYSDFLNVKRGSDLLVDYVEAFYNLNIRGNFVRSKTFFYSRNTGKVAYPLDTSSLELRHVVKYKNFDSRKDMIIFEDELSLERGNVKSTNKEAKTTGIKDLKALWGQLFEERNYWIQIKQNPKDEIKLERDLSQQHILIFDKVENNPYSFLVKWFHRIFMISSIFDRLKYNLAIFFTLPKNKARKMNFLNKKISKLRDKKRSLFLLNSFIRSLGFLEYEVRIYSKAEDVGKITDKYYESEKFTFPIKHCYGTYLNHDYASLLLYLDKYSINAEISSERTLGFKSYKKGEIQAKKILTDFEEGGISNGSEINNIDFDFSSFDNYID